MIRTGLGLMVSCTMLSCVAMGSQAQGGSPARVAIETKPESIMARLISLDVKGDLRHALDALFKQAGVNYIYSFRSVPTHSATVKVDNVSFEAALDAILRAYPAQPRVMVHRFGNIINLSQVDMQHLDQKGKKYPVTVHLTNARLDTAFRCLFSTLGTDYRMDNNQPGSANLDLRDAPYTQVLTSLMAQSPNPLRLTDRENYLILLPKPVAQPPLKNLKTRVTGKPVNP